MLSSQVDFWRGLNTIEQQLVTSLVKLVDKPIQSPTFLSLLEIDLMDFRNCPCDCKEKHTWAMNITDHHTKYVYVTPLKAKSADEVLTGFKRYCYTYGFPKKILTDNGKEFANKTMEAFCKKKWHSSGSWFSTNSNHSRFGWKIKSIVQRGYESINNDHLFHKCSKMV